MKYRKYLALALTLALLAAPCRAEEDGAPVSTAEPTPTVEPTPIAEPTPTAEPTSTAESTPTAEPTATVEPTPTVEPTATVEPTPTTEPTASAEPTPTVEPTPALPTPGEITEGAIEISLSGAENINGIWRVSLTAPGAQLGFSWTSSVENAGFVVYVDNALISDGVVQLASISLPATGYMGQHTLYVGAIQADGSAIWGGLSFEIAAGGGGGFPGGRGFSGGGRGAGNTDDAAQGFHVTPGTALTSSHASGTKTLAAFGAAKIPIEGEPTSAIVQADSGDALYLDGGENAFFALADDGSLTLTPAGAGECWQFSLLMLEALEKSGVTELRLNFDDGGMVALDTGLELSGALWGQLRAAGYVGKDCVLTVSSSGMRAQIDGTEYLVDADGALVPAR